MKRVLLSIAALVALIGLVAQHSALAEEESIASQAARAQREVMRAQRAAITAQKDLQVLARKRGGGDPESPEAKLEDRDHELENETDNLVAKYSGTTDDAARKAIVEELREKVNEHFKVRQEIRDQELAQLKAELVRLMDVHQQRNAMREQIVNDRVDQLLHDADGLGWGSGASVERRRLNYRIYMPPEFPRSPMPVKVQPPVEIPVAPKPPKKSDMEF